jgi:hypothetical protein
VTSRGAGIGQCSRRDGGLTAFSRAVGSGSLALASPAMLVRASTSRSRKAGSCQRSNSLRSGSGRPGRSSSLSSKVALRGLRFLSNAS